MVGQEAFDRAAQQRRVMSRHRRHDEKARLRPARRVLEGALEMQEPTERPLPYRRNVHWHMLAADHGGGDIPLRLAVAPRRALEQLQARGHGLAERRVGQRIGGIAIEQARSIGERARGIERRLTHFIEPVGRRRIHRAAGAECGRPHRRTHQSPFPRPRADFAALQHPVVVLSYSQHNPFCLPIPGLPGRDKHRRGLWLSRRSKAAMMKQALAAVLFAGLQQRARSGASC